MNTNARSNTWFNLFFGFANMLVALTDFKLQHYERCFSILVAAVVAIAFKALF